MAPAGDAPDGRHADPLDQLRHDLKTPLTTILARSQLQERALRRSPSLADAERETLLAGLVAIEAAVYALVAVIDAMDPDRPDPGDRAG
jgi:hypothetical protein